MIGFFSPSSNDQSIFYLDQLFGYMDNVLPVASGTLTLMGAMFKTINTTALVIGSLVVINTIVVGLLKTAQEGEFLGRQWSSFWVPFRTIAGVAALFPTPAGYSMLQIVMMWIILQGIGAADTLWTTVLEFVSQQGSVYAKVQTPTSGSSSILNNVTLPPLMKQLFQGLVCQAAMARKDGDIYVDSSDNKYHLYYCSPYSSTANSSFCKMAPTDMLNVTAASPVNGQYTYSMGPDGICGSMTFADPDSYVDTKNAQTTALGVACKNTSNSGAAITCAGIKQQVATLQAIVTTMASFASQMVEFDNEYWRFNYGMQVYPVADNCTAKNCPHPLPNVMTQPYPTPKWISEYCGNNKVATANCCVSTSATPGCTAPGSKNTFPDVFATTGGLANYYDASALAGTKLYWTAGLGPIIGLNTDETSIMTTKYLTDITNATNLAVTANGADLASSYLTETNNDGWITAGIYYYYLANFSTTVSTAYTPPLSMSSTNPAVSMPNPEYRILFQSASDVMGVIASTTSTTVTQAPPAPGLADSQSALNGAASSITNNFIDEISGGGLSTNPLISAQAFGEDLLISAQATYPVMLIAASVAIALVNINFMALGNGLTTNPVGPALEFLTMLLWGIYMFFAGWCFTFGGMLAIYLPLIPYIIFTFGAIGWFIAVIEAMIAAPFVAIGILSPTGHDMLGRAEPAIMIMMNTFLRPTLMIFGMMGGMLLAPSVIVMIKGGFNVVVGSIYGGGHAPGPVELILFISAYGSLVVTSLNKCFALIYMVPERVLTWIGGQAISYGEGDALGQVKSAVEGTAGAVKSGAESTGRSGMAAGGKMRGKQPKKPGNDSQTTGVEK